MLKVFARMTYAFAKACVLAAMTAACGCATILSRSRYNVPVQSNASATVEVRNRGELVTEARTPTMLTLPAKAGFFVPAKYTFTFKKPGCPDIVKSRSAYLDFMYVGNVVFGGLIGILIVDPATGAMWRMSEEPVSATYGQAIVEADAALAAAPALAAVKPYTIETFAREAGDWHSYRFVLNLNDAVAADLSVSRRIQADLRQSVMAEYMAASGTTDASSLRVDFPQYAISGGKVEGRAVVMMIELLEFVYDPMTAHGRLAVKFNARQYEAARQWVRSNIATLAKDKNNSILDAFSMKPSFTIGRELLRDDNVLEVEFSAGK